MEIVDREFETDFAELLLRRYPVFVPSAYSIELDELFFEVCRLARVASFGRRGEQALGAAVHAVVADDPASAAHLSDARPRPRRFDSSPLVRSLRATATVLAGRMVRASEVVAR